MLEFTLLTFAVAFLCSAFFPYAFAVEYAVACIFHEAGHLIVAKSLDIYTRQPKCVNIGAVIDLTSDKPHFTLAVALSGSLFNFLSSILALLLPGTRFYPFSIVSFFLGILNLIPIRTLDGYVILYTFLTEIIHSEKAVKFIEVLSDVLLSVCILCASFRMIKYGDSTLAFFFFVNCILYPKRQKKIVKSKIGT